MTIHIKEEVQTLTEMENLLLYIRERISEGYTKGYYPHWQLELSEEEKFNLIEDEN